MKRSTVSIIGIYLAMGLVLPQLAVSGHIGTEVKLGYVVHVTDPGFVDFDLQATNTGLDTLGDVTVEEVNGHYPPLYFGDLEAGKTASQGVQIFYHGEPPALDWRIIYTDGTGATVVSDEQ
jgi:hypothetical protein